MSATREEVSINPPTRGGRRVVLKPLDADCLLDGQLHPMIRQRLERVRELPLAGVANLIGVERDQRGIGQLVWEFVPGTPLAQWACDPEQRPRMMREVILAVEALHSAGIVHGAIHGRNVIVKPSGAIRLTHVSPLLYSEAAHDAADVIEMFRGLIECLPERSCDRLTPARDEKVARAFKSGLGVSPEQFRRSRSAETLGQDAQATICSPPAITERMDEYICSLLEQARSQSWSLSALHARLGELGGSPPPVEREETEPAPTVRFRSLVAAALAAASGIVLVLLILWWASDSVLRS